MFGDFDKFIMQLLNNSNARDTEKDMDLDEAEINYLYLHIVDKVVVRMFDNTIYNEDLRIAFRKLNRIEKMVILFNVAWGINLKLTAEIIGTSINSVKVQKNKAMKRLKQELAEI